MILKTIENDIENMVGKIYDLRKNILFMVGFKK